MEPLAILAFAAAAILLLLWLLERQKTQQRQLDIKQLQRRLKSATPETSSSDLQNKLASQQAMLNQQLLELQQSRDELARLRKQDDLFKEHEAALKDQKNVMDMQQRRIHELEAALANTAAATPVVTTSGPSEAEHFQLQTEMSLLRKKNAELTEALEHQAHQPSADPREIDSLKEQIRRLEQENAELRISVTETAGSGQPNMGVGDSTRDILVQQGKMATLGTLVAGVTHELNTPLGAITAAGESLAKIAPYLTNHYPNQFNGLGPQERESFLRFVELSANANTSFSSREEREYKKVITTTLEEAGVPDAPGVAKTLVKGGLVEGYEQFIPLLKHPLRDDIFDMVSNIVKLRQGVDNIQLAAKKMDRMVKGVRNYSHSGGDKMEPVNLRDSLETVLTLYHNKLKYGVEVTKHYEEGINPVMGVADELIQVWTNLVNNAAQAMNAEGKLDINLKRVGDGRVAVEVTDSGTGVPPEIQEKIFQPFFTTKPKGEGTGLGLDIVKKIVEKHGGSISLDSVPGRTTFTVVLPEYTGELQVANPMEGGIVGQIHPHA